MREEGMAAILVVVEKAMNLLDLSGRSSTSSDDLFRVPLSEIETLRQVTEELKCAVADLSARRALNFSGSQLMNAGVDLYNAPRTALKVLAQVEKSKKEEGDVQLKSYPRYLLVLTRFVAAKIMGISLQCSEDSRKTSMEFMEECVDVLRSYGRVGMLLLESASADCENCEEYLALANESFDSSIQLWSRIGLSHLTKFKRGLELEDIVDDLWDFFVDRVRVLQLLSERSIYSSKKYQEIVSSLHELKMLAPYKISYTSSLLDLIASVSDEYSKTAHHELQISLADEALRICDSLENDVDKGISELIVSFKQHVLVNLLQSLCSIKDIKRAEACYSLIPASGETKILLLMTKLYVEHKLFDKARRLLILLFEQDSLDDSILGARIYAQGLSFSETGLDIYRVLLDNYGHAEFVINLEIACSLAFVESKRLDAMSELKRIGCVLLEKERNGEAVSTAHILRVRQTIFDVLQDAQNSNQHEVVHHGLIDCLKWAHIGLATASTAQQKATYMRLKSRSCLQLGRDSEAVKWAQEAFSAEPSKQSLFAVIQAKLEAKPEATEDELVHLMRQLTTRDDFVVDDLLALGKQASDLGSPRHDLVKHVLDELCRMLLQTDGCSTTIPVAVVLQNAAQLAFSKFTPRDQSLDSEKFLSYASALLQASRRNTIDREDDFGPSSVFEWFFRMSFDIAKNTEDSRFFIVAADIAERSDELFGEVSPLTKRCQQCLLAAVTMEMRKIETLDRGQLSKLLTVIERIGGVDSEETSDAADVMRYLSRAVIAIKLRLFDPDTKAILDLCLAAQHTTRELMEIAAGSIDSSKLCYLLRRLVTLAESKPKAYVCFEQLLGFIRNSNVTVSELDVEWFVAKAWNIGVLCHREKDAEEAQKFMKIAQDVMRKYLYVKHLHQSDFHSLLLKNTVNHSRKNWAIDLTSSTRSF
ncbi:hypothetical protein PsorP6_003877 [Peronosclerospora sorghi]|uniref:Uncharacterized protein n=1 Tax=Peronosclerospora sorghi TaxID=230839 RepID=A0ACC0VNI4_9STRA|nr:hypothetical protein PsorP6_003877 [Peronosclerospora sorghi]